jgi:hypothetical protein
MPNADGKARADYLGRGMSIVGTMEAPGAPRFSFAQPDLMQEVLALTPRSVTPFGLIIRTQYRV